MLDDRLRRGPKAWLVPVILALVIAGTWFLPGYLTQPPSQERAAELFPGSELLAYEVWDGIPHYVVRSGERVTFGQLELHWPSVLLPTVSAWRGADYGYRVPAIADPAKASIARCPGARYSCDRDMQVFGEITAREIVAIEIQWEDAWHRFPAGYPGYLIRMDGFAGVPTAYRWLDSDNHVVWSQGRVTHLWR